MPRSSAMMRAPGTRALEGAEEVEARVPGTHVADARVLRAGSGIAPVGVEAAEVVDAHDVALLEARRGGARSHHA